jgi:micrococcal nuclease
MTGRRRGIAAAAAVGVLVAGFVVVGCDSSEPETSGGDPPALVAVPDRQPRGETLDGLVVDRVVDGDTVKVTIDGRQVSIRLIGINTPETVKPDSPVECFGPEASDFAKGLLDGQPIVLEFDETQGYYDRYERVLAYVWRVQADGSLRLFNEEAVAGGFAYERQYGDEPYAWRPEFAAAQDRARSSGAGLWSACEQP